MYRVGADNLGFSCAGSLVLDVSATLVESLQPIGIVNKTTGNYGSASKSGTMLYSTTAGEFIYSDGSVWRKFSDKAIVS